VTLVGSGISGSRVRLSWRVGRPSGLLAADVCRYDAWRLGEPGRDGRHWVEVTDVYWRRTWRSIRSGAGSVPPRRRSRSRMASSRPVTGLVPSWIEVGVEGDGAALVRGGVSDQQRQCSDLAERGGEVGPMAIGRGAVGSIGGCG
jgi:hypothetical protein